MGAAGRPLGPVFPGPGLSSGPNDRTRLARAPAWWSHCWGEAEVTKRSKESSSSCRKKGWQGAPVTPAAFRPHGLCKAPQAQAWVETRTPHQPAAGPEPHPQNVTLPSSTPHPAVCTPSQRPHQLA